VDNDAEVAVCYYDRRNDRANLRVDRFCSISDNLGKTWKDLEVSVLNWLPTPNKDPLSGGFTHVISEYDGLSSEFLLHSDGFFGAFVIELSGNPKRCRHQVLTPAPTPRSGRLGQDPDEAADFFGNYGKQEP